MALKVYFIYICINMMAQCKVFIGKGNKKAFLPLLGGVFVWMHAHVCVQLKFKTFSASVMFPTQFYQM